MVADILKVRILGLVFAWNWNDTMAVLKLKKPNEKKEIEFELDYLMSLSTQQRFEMMFQKSRQMVSLLKRNGRRKTTKVIKRT